MDKWPELEKVRDVIAIFNKDKGERYCDKCSEAVVTDDLLGPIIKAEWRNFLSDKHRSKDKLDCKWFNTTLFYVPDLICSMETEFNLGYKPEAVDYFGLRAYFGSLTNSLSDIFEKKQIEEFAVSASLTSVSDVYFLLNQWYATPVTEKIMYLVSRKLCTKDAFVKIEHIPERWSLGSGGSS